MITLLPHQIEDANFLASKKFAGNWSGMGSGKTLTALEAVNILSRHGHYQKERQQSPVTNLTIIVGPPISLHMWKSEYDRHIPNSYSQILRSAKTKIDPEADALVMSYEIATKLKGELKALSPRILILDESHACKSVKAKRTHALLGKGGLCESVEHTWCLTGTPSTRWNDDLYTFLARADNAGMKTRIGGTSIEKFRLRYCVTQQKQFKGARFPTTLTVGNRNTEELNAWMFDNGLAVRRELEEVWKAMPPITVNRLQVRATTDEGLRRMLRELDDMPQYDLDEKITSQDAHISTLRRKIGLAKVAHSAAEIADRVQAGVKPILVGAWHTEVIDSLVTALRGEGLIVHFLDGRTPVNARPSIAKAFNNQEVDVLVGQIKSMGVSLNLQGGSHIVEVETDWSPALMHQFRARCHRMGQKNHVHVDIFEHDNKIDQAVRRISATKSRGH